MRNYVISSASDANRGLNSDNVVLALFINVCAVIACVCLCVAGQVNGILEVLLNWFGIACLIMCTMFFPALVYKLSPPRK